MYLICSIHDTDKVFVILAIQCENYENVCVYEFPAST